MLVSMAEVARRFNAVVGRSTNSAPRNDQRVFWCLFGVYYWRALKLRVCGLCLDRFYFLGPCILRLRTAAFHRLSFLEMQQPAIVCISRFASTQRRKQTGRATARGSVTRGAHASSLQQLKEQPHALSTRIVTREAHGTRNRTGINISNTDC